MRDSKGAVALWPPEAVRGMVKVGLLPAGGEGLKEGVTIGAVSEGSV